MKFDELTFERLKRTDFLFKKSLQMSFFAMPSTVLTAGGIF